MVDFAYGAPKTCKLFKVSVVLPPPLWKISAGAHGSHGFKSVRNYHIASRQQRSLFQQRIFCHETGFTTSQVADYSRVALPHNELLF